MSGGQQKLRATVRELERELAAAQHLDDESRALLSQAASEIHDVLAKREESPTAGGAAEGGAAEGGAAEGGAAEGGAAEGGAAEGGAAEGGAAEGGGSLVDRMNEAARRFEASHPLLSGILEQIAESLGQMGI
jgi:colicin import membrane protein